MAYSKTTWSSGDTITAAKLNNMESGISDNADDIAAINQSLSEIDAPIDVSSYISAGPSVEDFKVNKAYLVGHMVYLDISVKVTSTSAAIAFIISGGDKIRPIDASAYGYMSPVYNNGDAAAPIEDRDNFISCWVTNADCYGRIFLAKANQIAERYIFIYPVA